MPDNISAKAAKLASVNLVLPEKTVGGAVGEDVIIIKEIIVDVPEIIGGRQIMGCFGIGEFARNSIYDKISQSVISVLNEASATELLALSSNIRAAKK